ncbi:MAG: HD domain-containing protein [Burkholderiaceae bacterium]
MNGQPQPCSTEVQQVTIEIKDAISHLFDASVVAHDLFHLERVYKLADAICVSEGGNRITVAAASLLHDYHRVIEKRISRHVSPEEVEPEIRVILGNIKLIPFGLHNAICDAVNFTEYYRCSGDDVSEENSTLEGRIVRDSDMLDAIGAVGIARAFMFGGFLGEPMWIPESNDAKVFVHGKTLSIVHHFHEKLLKLEFEMLTRQGQALAAERTNYMRQFIGKLMSEIA